MKKLLRWLGFHVHEWGPWDSETIIVRDGHRVPKSMWIYMWRTCQTCGEKQRDIL